MRIWQSFGSEHSMDLVLIGTFKNASDASAAVDRLEELTAIAEAEWEDDDRWELDERIPDSLLQKLIDLGMYELARYDVDNFVYDHSIRQDGATVRITTDESEVQGFLKVLLHFGGQVQIFSRHHWNEDGAPVQHTDT